jgi:hypothetical protein
MKNLIKFICVFVIPQSILFGQVTNNIDSPINYDNATKLFYSKTCKDSVLYGTYIWPNGDKYSGQFINGQRTGIGTLLWANGDEYSGEFINGKRTGIGTLIWANGDEYSGQFINDKRTGFGRYEWCNGTIFEGKWNFEKELEGIYYFKNGTSKKITNSENLQILTHDTLVRIENIIQFEKGRLSKCYSDTISNYLVLVSDDNEVIIYDAIFKKIISKASFNFNIDFVYFNPFNLSEIALISDRKMYSLAIHKAVITRSLTSNFKFNSLFFLDSTNFIHSGNNNKVQYANGKIICKGELSTINQLLKGQGSTIAFQELPLDDKNSSNQDYYNQFIVFDTLTKSIINSFLSNVDLACVTPMHFGDDGKTLNYVNLDELISYDLHDKKIKSIIKLESNILAFALNKKYYLCSSSDSLYVYNKQNNSIRSFYAPNVVNIKIITNDFVVLTCLNGLFYLNLTDLKLMETILIKSEDKSSLHGILNSEILFSRLNSNYIFSVSDQLLKAQKINSSTDLSLLSKGVFNFNTNRYLNSGFGKKSESYIMTKNDLKFLNSALGIKYEDLVNCELSFCQAKGLMAYVLNDNLFVYNTDNYKMIFSIKLKFENICLQTISLEFSKNGKYLLINSNDCGLYVVETETRKISKISDEYLIIDSFWSPVGDIIIACSPALGDDSPGDIRMYDVNTRKEIFSEQSASFNGANNLDSSNLLLVYNDSIKIFNFKQNRFIKTQPIVYKSNFHATWNNDYFVEYNKNLSQISFYKLNSLEFLGNYNFPGEIQNVVFWNEDILLIEMKNEYILFDLKRKLELLKFQFFSELNYITSIPNSPYYMCSKDASKMLHYVTPSLKVIGFEQLDPVYNRPDIVLDSIGKYFGGADQEMVANYRQSWEKRIERLGLDKEKLGKGEITVPRAEIVGADAISYENKEGKLNIKVSANDPKYPLRRFNVYINEVPLYGSAGISIAHLKKQVWDTTVNVPLSVGENKIQVSVMNELGLENFKYPTYVNYKPEKEIVAKTYYIGIGVNEFKDSSHNLNYCVKDVRDLAKAFSSENKNIDTLLFTDKQVTKENILALKDYLKKTSVNDKVIISCSSHGLLDDSLNFYLAMHDVDFDNPKARGLKYEELESLLDGIPARQKLLLLDACNSGENDKTEVLKKELQQKEKNMDSSQVLAARGVIIKLEEENKSNFKKMNELFVNVRNNTGSVIISAAGGQESALEAIIVDGKTIENGAFTYSILECIKQYEGKELKVNALKQYAEKRVEEITNGKQKPTSRQETMEVDWGVR